MLKTVLTPGWQSAKKSTRLKAIAKMDGNASANQPALRQLATSDIEQEVRRSALFKMTDPMVLSQIYEEHDDAPTRADAQAALWNMLGVEAQFDLQQSTTLAAEHPELANTLIKYSAHASLREDLLQPLSIDQQVSLIGDIHYTDTRQKIAAQIDSPELLEKARASLKGKDKSAEKIIRTKLDEIHELERIQAAQYEDAELIAAKMELVAKQEWQHDSKAKFSVWQQRWQALDFTPHDDLVQRYTSASAQAEVIIARQAHLEQAELKQTQLANELESYCRVLSELELADLSARKHELIDKHKRAVDSWAELLKIRAADTLIAEQVLAAKGAISSAARFCAHDFNQTAIDNSQRAKTLSTALAELEWPSTYPALLAASQAQEQLAQLDQTIKQNAQSATDKLDKLHKRINRLLGTGKRGDLAAARGELAAVTKAATHYQGRDRNALDERLTKATELVKQMSDWKDFATEPKFVELCESMETLIDSKQHPDKLAATIATLQDAWKALGQSGSADKHWDRFKAAADAAYQPCGEFFKKRQQQRRENLERREPLVKRMRELLEETDWAGTPEYKDIESELQSIHSAWQKIKDVERGPGQKQWKRISKLRASVYEKLDLVYDSNLDEKHKIIQQADALLALEVKDSTLDKLKFIQSKWKQVGVTRRKQDQAAWKKFKKSTDAVFEKIQNQRKAKRAAEDEKIDRNRDIINQIYALTKNAENLAEADHEFERLEAEYAALPPFPRDLPEKLADKIAADYRRAESQFSKAREKLLKQQKQTALDLLIKKSSLVANLEASYASGDAAKIAELSAAIDEIELPNNEQSKRMQARVMAAQNPDRSEANQARRAMCIDLEIMLGIDSPKEDASLRMQTQLQRMKTQGLGQQSAGHKKVLEKLKLDWLFMPGAEASLQHELDKRFNRLVSKA